jgi:peptidoglycan hydrolase-like protein with peptidoglycan-binding domain
MTIAKQLAQIAIRPIAMAATVGLCLWVLLGPLHIGRHAGDPVPEQVPALASTPEQIRPVSAPARTPDWKQVPFEIAGVAGDSGALVTQLQGALIKKNYSVGSAGANGNLNDDTLTALEAFQDDNALPVQPKCDQQCWTALGLAGP